MDTLDGGYTSRKYWLCVGAIALLTIVGVLTIWFPAIVAIYPELIGAVLGLVTIYCGVNVANTMVVSRAPAFTAQAVAKLDKPPVAEEKPAEEPVVVEPGG